jgi:maltose O-acetyltransferase
MITKSNIVNYAKRSRSAKNIYWGMNIVLQMFLVVIENTLRNIPLLFGGSWVRKTFYARMFKSFGKGGNIEEGIVFYGSNGIECGSNVCWGRNLVVQGAGGLKMGNNILIGPGCYIWTINHDFAVENIYKEEKYILKPVIIEDNVWIAANVKIVPGVRIGSGSVIGMGSVVTKDVPPNCVVAGNPAKIVKMINRNNKNVVELQPSQDKNVNTTVVQTEIGRLVDEAYSHRKQAIKYGELTKK